MVDDSIIKKIQKCLALADGNANDNEREQAMERAAALMAEHNLLLAEVQGADLTEKPEEWQLKIKSEPWVELLFSGLCDLFFTAAFTRSGLFGKAQRSKRLVLVGTDLNITATLQMGEYLMASIKKEARKYYSEAADRRSFHLGAANKLAQRAKAQAAAQRRPNIAPGGTPGTGLMVLRNALEQANQAHLDAQDLKKGRDYNPKVTVAAIHGSVFGEHLSLNKQVGVAAPKQLS